MTKTKKLLPLVKSVPRFPREDKEEETEGIENLSPGSFCTKLFKHERDAD